MIVLQGLEDEFQMIASVCTSKASTFRTSLNKKSRISGKTEYSSDTLQIDYDNIVEIRKPIHMKYLKVKNSIAYACSI